MTWKNEPERVAFLFELYQRYTSLLPADKKPGRKFIQREDPEIQKKRVKASLEAAIEKL